MDPAEYLKLAKVEKEHWFYVGKREIVRFWLNRIRPLSRDDLLVDCGAGTGTFAGEMTQYCRVIALDDHQESLQLARAKLGEQQVKEGNCIALPFADNSVSVITALDVIEHVREDRKAMEEFHRVLRPNGMAVITVPALPALWSDWDEVLHHFRRYTKKSLLAIVPSEAFEVVHCAYINVAVLPLVFAVRKFRGLKKRFGFHARGRSEDAIPPHWINRILKWWFVRLACQRPIHFPAGVGLLALLRKRS